MSKCRKSQPAGAVIGRIRLQNSGSLFAEALLVAIILLQCSRRREMYATEAQGFIIDWRTQFALESATGGGSL